MGWPALVGEHVPLGRRRVRSLETPADARFRQQDRRAHRSAESRSWSATPMPSTPSATCWSRAAFKPGRPRQERSKQSGFLCASLQGARTTWREADRDRMHAWQLRNLCSMGLHSTRSSSRSINPKLSTFIRAIAYPRELFHIPFRRSPDSTPTGSLHRFPGPSQRHRHHALPMLVISDISGPVGYGLVEQNVAVKHAELDDRRPEMDAVGPLDVPDRSRLRSALQKLAALARGRRSSRSKHNGSGRLATGRPGTQWTWVDRRKRSKADAARGGQGLSSSTVAQSRRTSSGSGRGPRRPRRPASVRSGAGAAGEPADWEASSAERIPPIHLPIDLLPGTTQDGSARLLRTVP